MVGRKTSGRCENCRRRKVKCDLTTPSCFQCLKSKLKCPGYNNHARFHAVNPIQVETKHSPQADLLSPTDILRSEYISKLSNGQLAARFWLSNGQQNRNVNALDLIPQRLGESRALDDAVKCVCSYSSSIQEADVTRRSYLNALGSLQDALDDNTKSMASGTLAAATLLYVHEIYSNPFQQGWMIHAEGLIRLLEVRGPERINTDLERAILHDQVGTIFLNAVQRSKHCFLASEGWNSLLLQLTRSGHHANGSENEALNILALAVRIPGLVCRFEESAANDFSFATWSLMQDVLQIRVQIGHWRNENDLEFDGQSDNEEFLNACTAPMKSAFQMTTILFLVMTGYMFVELRGRQSSVNSTFAIEKSHIPAMEMTDLKEECSKLAPIAKTKWLALKQTGREEAWASATPNVIMLRRVLKSQQCSGDKTNDLRLVVQDLYDCLSDSE